MTDSTSSILRHRDDLLAVFHDAEKKDDAPLRVGPEMEKSGVFRADGSPVPFDGERGVARILDEHVRRFGWTPESEFEGGPVIALRRGETAITLEPSCQFELSGAPMADIHGIAEEFRVHMDELTAITKPMGIAWLGIGFQPFATRGELPWVPKMRYGIMRRYLPTRGDLALDMMQRTCTVQANFDFTDEQDAMRKLRVALRLAPLTTAIFANSPFYEGGRSFPGAPQGGPTFRGKVWLHTDPDRSGLVPGVFKENSTYVDYVEWALDVPMFMFKRDGAKVENTGQTFRDFLANGFEGHRATQDDWTSHLNTLFPEVRLKRTIEVRGADAQPHRYAFALPALYTGIFYDAVALAEAEHLCRDFGFDQLQSLRSAVWQLGLRVSFRGKSLRDLALELFTIAEGGLARRNIRSSTRPFGIRSSYDDERMYLEPLRKLVEKGMTPADELCASLPEAPRKASGAGGGGAGAGASTGAADPMAFRRAVIEATDLETH